MEQPFALIIEDERDIAALFRHVLDMAGYRTEIALNGTGAIERLTSCRPDLVLLDLNLPGVSGDKILQTIRGDLRLANTRVIVVTAHSHVLDNLKAEPDLVLMKPISVDQITELLKRFQATIMKHKTVPLESEPWDRVTSLYNQPFFINRLKFSIRRAAEQENYAFAVLSVTLDRDGEKKDKLKIEQWITVLRQTAKAIKATVRPTDTLARFDQDHFCILIENVPGEIVPNQIAARIRKRLNDSLLRLGGLEKFPVRFSVLMGDRRYTDPEQVLRDLENMDLQAQ